jgi:hypothetical protein
MLRDVEIGYVRAALNTDRREVLIAHRKLDSLVCYENCIQTEAIGGAEADLLHLAGRCIGIEPEPQVSSSFAV